MEAELSKYRWFRDTVRRLLILGGLWPHLVESSRIYRVVAFTSAFILWAMASKVLGFTLANINRLSIFVNGLCFIFSYYTSALKVGYFVKLRQDLVLLNNVLGKKFEEELEVKEYRPLLLRHISQYTRLTWAACGITAFTLSVFSFMPIVFTLKHKKYLYIFQRGHELGPMKNVNKKLETMSLHVLSLVQRLVNPITSGAIGGLNRVKNGKYPFSVEGGSFLYWSVITVEASAGYFMFTLVSGIDNAFGLHGFRMCGMLRLLGHKYSQLRSVSELAECVRTHQMILRCRDALQLVYGPIILLTYLTSSLITCSLMYQADQLKKHMTLSRVLFLSFYIILKLLQAFTYAYYGALISKESENCLEAVYTSDWAASGNLQLMKNILIIRSQKPIVLNVKNFFVITMDMFAKIVHTTISYFFLLQTVTKED